MSLDIKLSENIIITGHLDGYVRIWDIDTKELISSFSHKKNVNSVCFHTENKYFMSCSGKFIYIWNYQTDEIVMKFKAHNKNVNKVKFSNDNKYILSIGKDKKAKLWKSPLN